MFLDDLPIWGFIGKVEKAGEGERYSLFTHIHYDIQYNADRVIQVDISTGEPAPPPSARPRPHLRPGRPGFACFPLLLAP